MSHKFVTCEPTVTCRREKEALPKLELNIFNMVKHIILWKLNPELTEEKRNEVKKSIKEGLESLIGKVPGLISVNVVIDGILDTANCDLMLDSTLESQEALKGYAIHPAHVAVADGKVRPYTIQRTCIDFVVDAE